MADYTPPVEKLLTYGDVSELPDWPDYLTLGFTSEHIPELIRMATDMELHEADSESLEVWGPLHAWRTLAQLKAEAAVKPLLGILDPLWDRDDDWLDEIVDVVAMIGPSALPELKNYLDDTSHQNNSLFTVADTFPKMVERYPQTRDKCIQIVRERLEQYEQNDPDVNAFLAMALVDMKDRKSIRFLRKVFHSGLVNERICGSLEELVAHSSLGQARW